MTIPKSDLVGQKDLMRWGALAIGGLALAVIAVNISGLLPERWLTGLRETRLEAGSLTALRAEVSTLRADLGRAQRANAQLTTRLSLVETNRGDFARRVGALEASVPMLLEAIPYDAEIDYNALTAGIGNGTARPAEGGAVSVTMRPLFAPDGRAGAQPMPPPVIAALPEAAGPAPADGQSFGLALGAAVKPELAWGVWLDIADQVGGLLIGLRPVMAPDDNGDGSMRLVAGPVNDYDEAMRLCAAIASREVSCQAAEFRGEALAQPE